VLSAVEENRLQGLALMAREELGIEIGVVTVKSRDRYGKHPSIEAFTIGIFNRWDIPDARKPRSLLVVLSSEDHELRIEAGSAYPDYFFPRMQQVIERSFIPPFRDGDYATGLVRGLEDLLLETRLKGDGAQPTLTSRLEVAALRSGMLLRHNDWRAWLLLGLIWAGLLGYLLYRFRSGHR
jgi:uncharacterized protein